MIKEWIYEKLRELCSAAIQYQFKDLIARNTKLTELLEHNLDMYQNQVIENKKLRDAVEVLKELNFELSQSNILKQQKLDNINKLLAVAVDVHTMDFNYNWAVICVKEGKKERVSFYKLNGNMEQIKNFLGWFKKENVIVDAHPAIKMMIDKDLY